MKETMLLDAIELAMNVCYKNNLDSKLIVDAVSTAKLMERDPEYHQVFGVLIYFYDKITLSDYEKIFGTLDKTMTGNIKALNLFCKNYKNKDKCKKALQNPVVWSVVKSVILNKLYFHKVNLDNIEESFKLVTYVMTFIYPEVRSDEILGEVNRIYTECIDESKRPPHLW